MTSVERTAGLWLGLDIDGTITADPGLFAELPLACESQGGQIHIVSSCSRQAENETRQELAHYGICFTELFLLPAMDDENARLCPYKELDWFASYLWQKVDYASRHRLDHFVDDDLKVIDLFCRYGGGTRIWPVSDRLGLVQLLWKSGVSPDGDEFTIRDA